MLIRWTSGTIIIGFRDLTLRNRDFLMSKTVDRKKRLSSQKLFQSLSFLGILPCLCIYNRFHYMHDWDMIKFQWSRFESIRFEGKTTLLKRKGNKRRSIFFNCEKKLCAIYNQHHHHYCHHHHAHRQQQFVEFL